MRLNRTNIHRPIDWLNDKEKHKYYILHFHVIFQYNVQRQSDGTRDIRDETGKRNGCKRRECRGGEEEKNIANNRPLAIYYIFSDWIVKWTCCVMGNF